MQTHRGQRHWSWDLTTTRPHAGAAGRRLHRRRPTRAESSGSRSDPFGSTTPPGNDVTPSGTAWSLDAHGSGWRLELDLDDTALPLPYVIDPAVTYDSSASASGSRRHDALVVTHRREPERSGCSSSASRPSRPARAPRARSRPVPKYNGVAMTKIASTVTTTASTYECAALYYLATPRPGTKTCPGQLQRQPSPRRPGRSRSTTSSRPRPTRRARASATAGGDLDERDHDHGELLGRGRLRQRPGARRPELGLGPDEPSAQGRTGSSRPPA